MKLTKEECLKSLSTLSLDNYCFDNITSKYPYLKYEYDCLFELIDKYFDNPPLKFEELKEGMWVWDNQQNEWIKINRLKMVIIGMNNYRYYIYKTQWDIPTEFEENRFYRKQVEE